MNILLIFISLYENLSNYYEMSYYKTFGLNVDDEHEYLARQLLRNLFKIPKKDKGVNRPTFIRGQAGQMAQADLLELPNDNGFEYALVIVDVGTRQVDAEPIGTKAANVVLAAAKRIFQRGIVKLPAVELQVDGGKEFKGAFEKYFDDKGIRIRVAPVGRHRSQGLVEAKNKQIGKAIFVIEHARDLLDNDNNSEWTEELPLIIDEINKKTKATKYKKVKDTDLPECEGDACELLDDGTKVRIQADQPISVHGKPIGGRFRATDIRWDPKVYEIDRVLLQPAQPPMYVIKGKQNVFTKNQLQVVPEIEDLPPATVRRKKN